MDLSQRALHLLAEDEQMAEHLTAAIWEKLPGYENVSLDRTELTNAIAVSMRSVLRVVGDRRRPNDEELAPARKIGERRAVQGVPIESMVGSWHNAERVLLERILATREPLTALEVQDAARRVGVAIDAMIGAATSAYREVGNEIYAQVSQVGVDLVSRLVGAEPLDPAEVDRRAGMVGVEAHLPHRALALAVHPQDGVTLARSRRALTEHLRHHTIGRVLVGSHQGFTLLLFAGGPQVVDVLPRILRGSDVPADTFVGLGEVRPRLNEAASSLHEAISALKVGLLIDQHVTCFEQVIPEILLAENSLPTMRMVASVLGPLEQREYLETLRTFLHTGLSTRSTARTLGVHENTAAYRIRRICELLGVDKPAALVRPDILLALRAQEIGLSLQPAAGAVSPGK